LFTFLRNESALPTYRRTRLDFQVGLKIEGSNLETGRIPDLFSLMAAQNFSLPIPMDVIGQTLAMIRALALLAE
jgi:hypothetical protein